MKKVRRNKKSKKKIITIISVILVLIIIIIGIILFVVNKINSSKINVILKDDLEVEINSKVKLLSFIDKIENGEVVSEDVEVDTSSLGTKSLEIELKNKDKKETYKFDINVVDTTAPVIEAEDNITINIDDEVDLVKYATVSDNSKEDIKVEIEGDYDLDKAGKYNLKYVAKDSSGNEVSYDFILNIVEDPNNRSFVTSKGFVAKVVDGVTYIDGVLIVNKTYSLPEGYGSGLTTNTTNAFNSMQKDASKEGLNLYISSGYRSYYTQKTLYNNYVARDGVANADTYSARAGHSEHQTGLAFDLNTIDESFANTKEGKWVSDNCYKYGLILRYPKGKENITGYMYESWHLRYVGVELATKLYNNGNWITLEEYYGIDSKYS